MLKAEQIRALIVCRCRAINSSCNSFHINHVEGQVRALVAVLNDGVAPEATGCLADYLDAAKIPYTLYKEKGIVKFMTDWLESHDFIVDIEHDTFHHKTFKQW